MEKLQNYLIPPTYKKLPYFQTKLRYANSIHSYTVKHALTATVVMNIYKTVVLLFVQNNVIYNY